MAESRKLRIRNVGLRRVRVSEIVENPKNYRTHGEDQRQAFAATLDEIGFYGYPDVFEVDGQLMLVDGELRKQHLVEHWRRSSSFDARRCI